MAKNWLMELTKLAKSDPQARELLKQLKNASTDEEKQKAKENGKAYIENTEAQVSAPETTEPCISEPETAEPTEDAEPVETDVAEDSGVVGNNDVESNQPVQTKIVDKKYDMSEPAFNPRLAKMGITREEELFQMHVFVRKLTREDKLEIRRSIYQKKKKYMSDIQNRFREERAKKMAALQADPEYQKYQNQQRYVLRIEEALKAHCNIDWMLKNIEGLTVDIVRELLQTPANVNRFREQKAEFVPNFYKKFGK